MDRGGDQAAGSRPLTCHGECPMSKPTELNKRSGKEMWMAGSRCGWRMMEVEQKTGLDGDKWCVACVRLGVTWYK